MKNISIFCAVALFAAVFCTSCNKDVDVVSIELSQTTLTLAVDSSYILTATVKPDNATNKAITWVSSNNTTVSIDENGNVTAKSVGTANITAKAGGKTATCEVTVTSNFVEVESIALVPYELTLEAGQTGTLTATVLPDNASNPAITWTSDNLSVATVENGTVTAVSYGTATITAKAGEKTAICVITVNPSFIEVTSITAVPNEYTFSEIGEKKTLYAVVLPNNATDPTVTWTSNNTDIATVSNNGVVTAQSYGTTKIIAKAGNKTCEVIVKVKSYIETVEFNRAICLAWSASDVIDVYNGTLTDGSLVVDSVIKANVILLGTGVDFINGTGFVGSGAIIWAELPILYREYKTGQNAGTFAWTLQTSYVADNTLITSRDEIWTYGPDQDFVDVLPFLKGTINLNAINAGGTIANNVSGTEILFLDNGVSYSYGIVTQGRFTIGINSSYYIADSYNLTGEIMLFWDNEENFYTDLTGQYVVEKAYAGDVSLETLNPWIKTAVSTGAPAKVAGKSAPVKYALTKIAPAKLNKMKSKKLNNIDWSKARVLNNKSRIK